MRFFLGRVGPVHHGYRFYIEEKNSFSFYEPHSSNQNFTSYAVVLFSHMTEKEALYVDRRDAKPCVSLLRSQQSTLFRIWRLDPEEIFTEFPLVENIDDKKSVRRKCRSEKIPFNEKSFGDNS